MRLCGLTGCIIMIWMIMNALCAVPGSRGRAWFARNAEHVLQGTKDEDDEFIEEMVLWDDDED